MFVIYLLSKEELHNSQNSWRYHLKHLQLSFIMRENSTKFWENSTKLQIVHGQIFIWSNLPEGPSEVQASWKRDLSHWKSDWFFWQNNKTNPEILVVQRTSIDKESCVLPLVMHVLDNRTSTYLDPFHYIHYPFYSRIWECGNTVDLWGSDAAGAQVGEICHVIKIILIPSMWQDDKTQWQCSNLIVY